MSGVPGYQSLVAALLVLVVGLGRRLAADQAGPGSTAARLALYSCTGIPATSDQNSREQTYREHTGRSGHNIQNLSHFIILSKFGVPSGFIILIICDLCGLIIIFSPSFKAALVI